MTTIAAARFVDSYTTYSIGDHAAHAQAPPCAASEMASAFESAPGPRRKRGASDESAIHFDCVDPADTWNEPATVVQRIPV
ncbi:hypothetical protein BOSP111201_20010 [Bordetella sputigena]|uniref:hypothetical protein n=1 Tax=Bordetella sputigena TaxID=1416810 RepID=UPI0039F146D3